MNQLNLYTSFFVFVLCVLATACFGVEPALTPADSGQFVTVTGATVRAPGKIPWTSGITLNIAIKRAGGFGFRDPKYVFVIRRNERLRFKVRDIGKDSDSNPILQPGDTIEAPE